MRGKLSRPCGLLGKSGQGDGSRAKKRRGRPLSCWGRGLARDYRSVLSLRKPSKQTLRILRSWRSSSD